MEKEKKGRQYQDTVFRMYFNEETRLKESFLHRNFMYSIQAAEICPKPAE